MKFYIQASLQCATTYWLSLLNLWCLEVVPVYFIRYLGEDRRRRSGFTASSHQRKQDTLLICTAAPNDSANKLVRDFQGQV